MNDIFTSIYMCLRVVMYLSLKITKNLIISHASRLISLSFIFGGNIATIKIILTKMIVLQKRKKNKHKKVYNRT